MKRTSLSLLWCIESSSFSFFLLVVPVLMRQQGFDLTTIGLMYALAMPQLFKWLFSPLFDRYSLLGKGESGWLLLILVLNAVLLCGMTIFELKQDFWLLYAMMMVSSLLSQLIAVLCCSVVVKNYQQEDQGWLNGLMVSAMSLGMVIGGGVLLYFYDAIGWSGSLFVLALINVLAMFILPKTERTGAANTEAVSLKRIWTLFKKPGIRRWAVVMMLFYGANQGLYSMLKPFLVDLGLPNQQIAMLTGIFSAVIGVASGLIGSVMVKRLGARQSLNFLALVMTISVALFLNVESSENPLVWLYPACTLLVFSSFSAFTVLCAVSMSYCDHKTAATDFSILSLLPYLGAMPFATLSGMLTEYLGYQGFFIASAVFSLGSLVVIYLTYRGKSDVYFAEVQ